MSPLDTLVTGARLHRFGDNVAINWIGVPDSTHYLAPEVARTLGSLLLVYAEDCRLTSFTMSRLGSRTVESDGTTKKE